jgi:hypothetical protein
LSEGFVDLTITVVVSSIAKFSNRSPCLCRTLQTGTIGFATVAPDTAAISASRGTTLAFLTEIFIDLTITIVVFSIADFAGCGAAGHRTFGSTTVGAADVFAGALAFALTSGTTSTEVAEVFVDASVTIVVFAVTDFSARSSGTNRAFGS